MEEEMVIGIDLGGTKIEMGLVHSSGEVKDSIRVSTDADKGPQAIQYQLLQGIEELKKRAQGQIRGIGIGIAGQVDSRTGTVLFAPNLTGWHQIPLQQSLEQALQLPVKVVNDVRAITLAEWLYGAGRGYEDVVCLFVGTGIGSGIISGGRPLTGCSHTCGEVGHMVVDFQGPPCTCGNKGCLEALAGGWGIAKYAKDSIRTYGEAGRPLLELANNQLEAVTTKLVVEAYRKGDPLASLIMERAKQALITGCTNIVNVLNPCCLILGGGVIEGLPEWLVFVEMGVKRRALKAATHGLQVKPAELGKQVGVMGAAAAFLMKG